MKVLLIAPPIMDYVGGRLRPISMDAERECPPYGMYMLAAVLRNDGHDVVLADLIARGSRNIAPFERDLVDCDLVGIGATSMSWATARDVIAQIRRRRDDVAIVLGAIHPTMFDRYLLDNYPVQYVIRGEGELALAALCRTLESRGDLGTVPNLTWRAPDGSLIRNPLGAKIASDNLASFPLPDYSAVPKGIYKGLAIESSRGCSFDCAFCSTSYRKSYRKLTATQFVDRLEQIIPHVDRTRYGTVHIIDDEFSLDPRRATEIAQLIRARGLDPWLVFDSRATDLLWEGYVENIAEYTCQFLVGCECGYDEGLAKIGKGTTCEILENAAAKLLEYGISDRADFSFIVGLPWETRAEVERTVQFAMHLFGTYGVRILLQWYCQIPGSRLWEQDRQDGIVNESMYDDYGFFRDLYLFRSGVRLSPREIYEIGDMVSQLQFLASIRYPDRRMVEFTFPQAIRDNFPRPVLEQPADTGLVSLRAVSRPPRDGAEVIAPNTTRRTPLRVGLPERHFLGNR